MATDKDILSEALEQWRVATDAESENREAALDDKKFAKLGEQWPDKIRQEREAENRPCLTINKCPQFLKQVINDQRMNKPAITVRPVDDEGDPQTARILQGLIRNIEISSSADTAYDVAFDDAVTMGFGYFRIVTEYAHDSTFEQDVKIKQVENAFTVYMDPVDLFNPQFAFVTEMVKRSTFKRKYGFLPKPVPSGGKGESMEGWYDGDLVRVAEYWRIQEKKKRLLLLSNNATVYADAFNAEQAEQFGITVKRERDVMCPEVKQYMMTGQEFAGDPIDWMGKWIPIIPVLGETINIEGKRHFQGLIRHAKDPQRMFNFWRTMSTESVALAPKTPFIGPVGAFDTDADKWATANTKSHAYLQYDAVGPTAPARQPFVGVPAGALQEALNASDDMKAVMGLYDASLGAKSNETSGIAIQTRQREGDVSTFNFIDNLSRSLEHAGRILVDLIPKVYDTARVVRILGEGDEPETVKINQMFMGEDGKAVNYDLSTGKYDVIVKVGPSFSTQREETATSMIEFMKAYPPAGAVLGDLLAKQMEWPESDKVAERLQALLPPPVQQQDPMVQQLQGLMQQMDQHAKEAVGQLQGQLQDAQKQLEDKAAERALKEREIGVKEYAEQTKRIEALAAIENAEMDRQSRVIESANSAIQAQQEQVPQPLS